MQIGTHSYAAHMEDTSDNRLKLLHLFRQLPEYLSMKTCQQISLNFAMFQWSADNHRQLFFLFAPNFCDSCCLNQLQCPASCASSRE